MNDAFKDPPSDWVLKLHWASGQDSVGGARQVIVELQNINGLGIASMSVPREQLMQAVARKLEHHPLVLLNGLVSVFSDEISEVLPEDRPITLDQLITDAISPGMLEDEPRANHMLVELRARLLKSLELVDQAIASLPKP